MKNEFKRRWLDKGEDLTLAKALEIPQQFAMSQRQMKIVREEDTRVSAMSSKAKHASHHKNVKSHDHKQVKPTQQRQTRENKTRNCSKCGKDSKHPWNEGKCPVKGSTCSYCNKPNHWATVCRNRTVNSVEVEPGYEQYEGNEEILDINVTQEDVPVAIVSDDNRITEISILSQQVEFRIDTGAKCNTMTLNSYQSLMHTDELKRSNKVLRTYSNHKLKLVAAVDLPLAYKDHKTRAELEIIDIQQENVLSGTTAEALGLIVRLDSLQDGSKTSKVSTVNDAKKKRSTHGPVGLEDFPELTRTTGTLPGKYTIKLDLEAKPVVHPVRRQPVALRAKIEEKLNEMVEDGHIAQVDQPTEWISSNGCRHTQGQDQNMHRSV